MFEHLANLYQRKNADYGNGYKKYAAVMKALFPAGLQQVSEEDHEVMGVFTMIIEKVYRVANLMQKQDVEVNFESIADSLDDLSVGAQILKKVFEEIDYKHSGTKISIPKFYGDSCSNLGGQKDDD